MADIYHPEAFSAFLLLWKTEVGPLLQFESPHASVKKNWVVSSVLYLQRILWPSFLIYSFKELTILVRDLLFPRNNLVESDCIRYQSVIFV